MIRPLRIRSARRGFSIPEVVVAVVIGSMLLATAVGLVWVFSNSSKAVLGATAAETSARSAIALLDEDLSTATACGPAGLSLPVLQVDETEIVISTSDGTTATAVRYRQVGDSVTRSTATSCTAPVWAAEETVLISDAGLVVDFALVGPTTTHPGDCYTVAEATACREGADSLSVVVTLTVPAGGTLEPVTVQHAVQLDLSSTALPW